MFHLMALDKFEIKDRGTVFIVESPVESGRSYTELREALGSTVEIDGIQCEPVGFETNLLASRVRIGERIGILVR